jgi:hypothetical protein
MFQKQIPSIFTAEEQAEQENRARAGGKQMIH